MNQEQTEYFKTRSEQVIALKDTKNVPYPHYFKTTKTFREFIDTYSSIEASARMENVIESLAGRIMEIREASKKLYFLTVISNSDVLQFVFDFRTYFPQCDAELSDYKSSTDMDFDKHRLESFKKMIGQFYRGDIIGVTGFVGKTHKGELSLFATSSIILAPCLHQIPKACFGLQDEETRIRKRYLDLIANQSSRQTFIIRSKVINYIRNYLNSRNFMEIQTEILSKQTGGASAKPFITHHNDLNMDMFMRISPELRLKEFIIGGFDRVYEIGPQFRNESISYRHNPEFYSLEFYMAYADYNQLMKMCEEIISGMALEITGSYLVKYKPHNGDEYVIDFTPPYKKFDMIDEIEKNIGETIPRPYDSEHTRTFLVDICNKFKVDCEHPRTTARMLDKLCGHFVEIHCAQPAFIINHPLIMSPLAKWHRDDPQKTERFEFYANKFELCNAYTELNDPFIQRETFNKQMKDKAMGDAEAQEPDETFLSALEHGLPPTAGFGMGIERMTMLMANREKIQDVICNPTLRPE